MKTSKAVTGVTTNVVDTNLFTIIISITTLIDIYKNQKNFSCDTKFSSTKFKIGKNGTYHSNYVCQLLSHIQCHKSNCSYQYYYYMFDCSLHCWLDIH